MSVYDYGHISQTWQSLLNENDFWEIEGVKVPILSHRAVEKLARHYGVGVVHYEWVSPSPEFLLVMVGVKFIEGVASGDHDLVTYEIGEASPENLEDEISYKYPASIAWKRAYDRAVLKHLGIEAYSAEEASDFNKGRKYTNKQNQNNQYQQQQKPISQLRVDTQTSPVQTGVHINQIKMGQSQESCASNLYVDPTHINQVSSQVAQPKVVQPQVQPQIQPQIQPKVEPQVQPKVEPQVQPKVEPQVQIQPQKENKPLTQLQKNALVKSSEVINRRNQDLNRAEFDLNDYLFNNYNKGIDDLTYEEAGDAIINIGRIVSGS